MGVNKFSFGNLSLKPETTSRTTLDHAKLKAKITAYSKGIMVTAIENMWNDQCMIHWYDVRVTN